MQMLDSRGVLIIDVCPSCCLHLGVHAVARVASTYPGACLLLAASYARRLLVEKGVHGCACAMQVMNGTLWLYTTNNVTANLPVAIVVS